MGMKWPPEVKVEVERLEKICRDDQHLIIDGPRQGGVWSVYLQDAAPLVESPQTFDEMTTYYKHLVRTGGIDTERVFKTCEGRQISHAEFLEEFCNS